MIRAQMTLKDGKTPGAMRQGAAAIEVCLANGCRIYPNPLNRIPDEYRQHVLDLDHDLGEAESRGDGALPSQPLQSNDVSLVSEMGHSGGVGSTRPTKSKRPRIKRVKQ